MEYYNAVTVKNFGGPEELVIKRKKIRELRPEELMIKTEASSVSAADIMLRNGLIPVNPEKLITGYDSVGFVTGIGKSVSYDMLNKRVIALTVSGGNSEIVYAAEKHAAVIPEDHPADIMAALGLNYVTAYGMMEKIGHGKVFFQGLTGGLGMAFADLVKNNSRIKLAGSLSPGSEKLMVKINVKGYAYDDHELIKKARKDFPDGFDTVIDPFGGKEWNKLKGLLSKKGRIIGVGYSGTKLTGYLLNLARYKMRNRFGRKSEFYSIRTELQKKPFLLKYYMKKIISLYEEGRINPFISARYPLGRIGEAHRHFERKGTTGKIIIKMQD